MIEEIRSSLDNKRYGCGIFVGLQKACDTANHSILLTELEHYGISGNVLDGLSPICRKKGNLFQ